MSIHDVTKVRKIGASAAGKTVYSSKMIMSDGYLVEPRPDVEGVDKDGKVTHAPDGFNLIAVSLVSTKSRIEEFGKSLEEDDVHIQKQGLIGFATNADTYCVKRISRKDFYRPLSMIDSEHITRSGVSVTIEGTENAVFNVLSVVRPDIESNVRIKGGRRARFTLFGNEKDLTRIQERVKIEGCAIKDSHEVIEGTLFKRCLFINPKCRPDDLDGDSKEAYLIGETREEARSQFWTILDCLTPPFQPEWEEQIWIEFQRHGWVTELPGHRIFGYKLELDQEKLLDMLCARIADDSLPNIIPVEFDAEPEPVGAVAA